MTKIIRITKDHYFTKLVRVVSERGTCVRRQTGCILVNERYHILATGYNGAPSGFDHCFQTPCEGANYESGDGLDKCQAIHAEANALLQCPDVWKIHTAYCTTAPCIHCIKLLLNTSCHIIYFAESYPHMETARMLWTNDNRIWTKHLGIV